MNTDIRLKVGFFFHPKTIKLKRRFGSQGVESLLTLWCWSSQYRPDGVLSGMTHEDIEIAACWNYVNDRSTNVATFVDTLIDLRWIDVNDGVLSLHGWGEHNGYASSSSDRSDKSRFSRLAKLAPSVYAELREQGVAAISAEDYKRLTTVQRPLTNRSSPIPSPIPSPSPLPSLKTLAVSEVVSAYHDVLGSVLPHIRVVSGRLETHIRARCREDKARNDISWWQSFFRDEVLTSDFLCGRGSTDFRADLHWLVGAENMAKVLNGRYGNHKSTAAPAVSKPSPLRAALDKAKGTDHAVGNENGRGDGSQDHAVVLTPDANGRYAAGGGRSVDALV
jgi:hypothetical protein